MKKKEKSDNLVKGSDLPARLKEVGIEIEPYFVNDIPFGTRDNEDSDGLLKDGTLNTNYYYNFDFAVEYAKKMPHMQVLADLKTRGYDVKPEWFLYFPHTYKDSQKEFNVETIIEYLGKITPFNLADKLKEQGYEPGKEQIDYILTRFNNHGKNAYIYDIPKIIEYLNTPNDNNLKEKLKQYGYDLSEIDLKILHDNYTLTTYKEGGYVYDIEKVLECLKKEPPMKNIKDMKKELIPETFVNTEIQDFYSQASNMYSHFPISKWYAAKYNTIPDVCYLGHIYISELLDLYKTKILWYHKGLTSYPDYNDIELPSMLRFFSDKDINEYISEALIEIEDGMFLLMTDGTFNREKATMSATNILFYKEGIHDPTSLLKFVSDQYIYHDESGTLGLLYHDGRTFNSQDFDIPKPEIDFNLHYNSGFEQVHKTIHSALNTDKGKGLVLLHGKPGTGKTSYIRYLINMVNKNKIFVPPNLTMMLSDPGFIPFLMENPNSILFVEDAEDVLLSRDDGHNNQAVSNILNITDGLLSDCLNIQIVATFNTHLKNIDPALLRKGRLIAQYEFKELESARAEKLGDKLKVWLDDTSHLTLADIYAAKVRTV